MDASLPALPAFVVLLLGFTHTTQAFEQLDDCSPPRICPAFTHVPTNQDELNYEERVYEESNWICRKMTEGSKAAAMGAHFWLQQFTSGKHLTDNAWPVLLSVKGEEFSLCWMLTTEDTDIDVDPATVMTIPKTTFYVRSFNERQSIDDGKQNAQNLRADLESAGQRAEPNVFYGAGYNSALSFHQHNEIWIPKAEN